ncbi:LPS export ABC transporter periplasmic protein LptC [Candidatus Pelagibacter sp. HIMB1782]|uniref:LPS export ABC transporter periplasmic protein LptC n=1 Tax=Candidatus Pelagibacter sp. HIMB1782 TaxID=3413375 RepID=UPI003F86F992
MALKKIYALSLIFLIFIIVYIGKKEFFPNKNLETNEELSAIDNSYSSNLIKEVNYISKDSRGNEYIINAEIGEIDIKNPDIIYLTSVKALINLKNSETIIIKSDYGKYNTKNFDTIFSQNVNIDYLDKNITGEYLDFSLEKNLMLISRNIVYTGPDNILKADAMEMDIQTKDSKIFMYEQNKKINIKSKN